MLPQKTTPKSLVWIVANQMKEIQTKREARLREIEEAKDPRVRHALTLAYKEGWGVKVLDERGMLMKPMVKDYWRYEPLHTNVTIPPLGVKRMHALISNDIQPLGFVIGHDTRESPLMPKIEEALVKLKKLTITTTKVGVAVAATAALGLLMGLAVVARALAAVDPQIIAVLPPDGTWLVIYTYYE